MGAGEAAKEYVAGFAAGLAMVITGHPFDTIKVKYLFLNYFGS
jgi:solute carrier family 25 (mitochondrial carnitine/acylcarnitine transporter), member 20/29